MEGAVGGLGAQFLEDVKCGDLKGFILKEAKCREKVSNVLVLLSQNEE